VGGLEKAPPFVKSLFLSSNVFKNKIPFAWVPAVAVCLIGFSLFHMLSARFPNSESSTI